MIQTCLCILLLLSSTVSSAQQTYTVQGRMTDAQAQPLLGVNVRLVHLPDSASVAVDQTDQHGRYALQAKTVGRYLVIASFVGMNKAFSRPFVLNPENTIVNLPTLLMTEDVTTLEEVAVTAEKRQVELADGKLVYNLENRATASGNSAFDLLQRTPGVSASQEGDLLLNGYANVNVLLDGKMTNLSPQQLSNLLKGMPSESLSRIEVITTPTSQYDAAGNAGIINIITKKSKQKGYALDISAGLGRGRYPQAPKSLTGNVATRKINIFGNYSYFYRKDYLHRTSYRVIDHAGETTVYDRASFDPSRQHNQGYKVGIDYDISKNQAVGLVYNGFSNQWSRTGSGPTFIIPQNSEEKTVVQNQNRTVEPSVNHAFNLNYKVQLDSPGKQITVDADYSTYINNSRGALGNRLLNEAQAPLQPYQELTFDQPSRIKIRSLKADATLPLKSIRLATGLKYSYVTIDNNFVYDSLINVQYVFSPTLSNHFTYDEQIVAAYATAAKQWGSVKVDAGLRAEKTLSEGNAINLNRITPRNYINFFPYLSVEKQWDKQHVLSASLTRRINRPLYSNLNPSRYFFDKFSYYEGNPLLRPEVSWNAATTYSFRSMYTLTLGFVHTNNPISSFARQNNQTGELVVSTLNFSHRDDASALLIFPVYLADFWEMQNTITLRYLTYAYLQNGAVFRPEKFTVDVSSVQTFSLPQGHALEVSAYYTSPSLDGVYLLKHYFTVDAGYRKAFLNEKLNLRLSVTDLFRTIHYWGYSIYDGANVSYNHTGDTRRVILSMTYHLGGKLKSGKERPLEEEKRVQ